MWCWAQGALRGELEGLKIDGRHTSKKGPLNVSARIRFWGNDLTTLHYAGPFATVLITDLFQAPRLLRALNSSQQILLIACVQIFGVNTQSLNQGVCLTPIP